MDIVLLQASVLALPASQRADAIVYDGTIDLGLWPPPGPDRDLLQAYGESLPAVLVKERSQLAGGRLEFGQALRLHPGKLRADYLIWVGGRSAHAKAEPASAPSLEQLEHMVRSALTLAVKHDTTRVAFGVLGGGADAADASERMAAVVRAAHAFRDGYLNAGQAVPIEEVLVCSTNAAEVAKAKRMTARLAREPVAVRSAAPPRASRAASTASGSPRRSRAKRLDPAELSGARARASAYDRGRVYVSGEWFLHPTLGMAQVQDVLIAERMLTALFEDGQERRLVHARA